MEQYVTKDQLKDYLVLPSTFDWDLVDQEAGFNKIFNLFPSSLYNSCKNDFDAGKKDLYKLLTKAGVFYSFILAIPKLKVHINGVGVQQFELDKLKPAPWWDVRDLGLSMLKIADKLFSDAITKAYLNETLRPLIPLFDNTTEWIKTPEEFENIYSINYSPETFVLLQKHIKKALLIKVNENLKTECIEQIKGITELRDFLKDALVYYSLYYASLLPGFIFTQSAVVIQYDELPWQKSIVLDPDAKTKSGENFLKLGDESIKVITDYIKKNISLFPCYNQPVPNRKPTAKKSGLYL